MSFNKYVFIIIEPHAWEKNLILESHDLNQKENNINLLLSHAHANTPNKTK